MRAVAAACLLALGAGLAPPHSWRTFATGAQASLRGLSVASARVAWASGTGGEWLRTEDGGAHWRVGRVPGAERLDFRGIVAWNARLAYLMSSGSGPLSTIYKTEDGGAHWRRQWQAREPAAFLDAIAFWDARHGLALSDPVAGRFLILATTDGGRHWRPEPPAGMPPALPGEGVFAASNSSLALGASGQAWFVTGGAAQARIFHSHDGGRHWTAHPAPLASGGSRGIFSLALCGGGLGAMVGGDYRQPRDGARNAAFTRDGGRTWRAAAAGPPDGFMSAVACVPGAGGKQLIALGPDGTDLSRDGGRTWRHLSTKGANALAFAPGQAFAYSAGGRGALATLRW